jgi:hypothetical protein
MPVKKSNFGGLGRQRKTYRAKPIPLVNPKKMDQGSALTASVAAISMVVDQLYKILKGPMAQATQFLREYVVMAAKNLSDLLKQLTHKLGSNSELDALAVAATSLLDTVAEIGEDEVAADLADALQAYASAKEDPELLSMMIDQVDSSKLTDVVAVSNGTNIAISGKLRLDCAGVPLVVKIEGEVPFQAFDHRIEGIG